MLRKILKIVFCMVFYLDQICEWLDIFEIWPVFNKVKNDDVVFILSMLFALVTTIGFVQIILWLWKVKK